MCHLWLLHFEIVLRTLAPGSFLPSFSNFFVAELNFILKTKTLFNDIRQTFEHTVPRDAREGEREGLSDITRGSEQKLKTSWEKHKKTEIFRGLATCKTATLKSEVLDLGSHNHMAQHEECSFQTLKITPPYSGQQCGVPPNPPRQGIE